MTQVTWHDTLDAARETAATDGKLVLTYIHAPG